MEVVIGLKCANFVMLAADMTVNLAFSIIVLTRDDNKFYKLSNKLILAAAGGKGDTMQFSEFISRNISLYKLRNGFELCPKATASFIRDTIASALRTMNAYSVNVLMAGYDEQEGPKLFYIDDLATMVELKYAAHGFGGLFSFSVMDRYYSHDLTREAAYELLKKCVQEVHQRCIINLPNFKVQVVDKDGIHDLPNLTIKDSPKQF